MTIKVNTNWNSLAMLVVMWSVGCAAPGMRPEVASDPVDTSGSWPSPDIEAMVRALEADTITSDTILNLFNERHQLRIVGVGDGLANHDLAFRIQLTGPNGLVLDTMLTKTTFADSLDAGFLGRAGLYALKFDFVRSQSLYFEAFIGVDETCYVEHINFFLTYAGERKGRMIYWVVPEEEVNDP